MTDWGRTDEGVWDEINDGWGDTGCVVFRDSVMRRDANVEAWGVFVTGGIFDTITSVPFPGR